MENKKYTRTTVRNFINRVWQNVSAQRFHDNDWSGFHNTIKYLQWQLDAKYGEDEVKIIYYCQDGGYRKSVDGMSLWKEYIIEIEANDKTIIKGYINCCACGTHNDPFDTYDMVFVNWLHNDEL